MRDRLDRRRKVHLPWKEDYFRHLVAEIRRAAGIDFDAKFMGPRHGGNTESGNADLTDAQIRALSGHKTSAMTALYTNATMRQRKPVHANASKREQKGGICRNERLMFCRNHRPESRQVFEMIGGRTRTRTLDPLIKSYAHRFR